MRFNRKTIIAIIAAVLAVLLIGGIYLWYAGNYGNRKKIVIPEQTSLDYEWKNIASENGITVDYLWNRIKELMLENAEDKTLIPSNLMIEGRLVSEPQEESGVYKLSDQALLLKMYVGRNDRFAADALFKEVNSRFDFASESNFEKSAWLESYLEYYVAFGKSSDYDAIIELSSLIFDENGNVIPEPLSVSSYSENPYTSMVEIDENTDPNFTLEGQVGEASSNKYSFDGVELSSINLFLIDTLEKNGILPAGSYEKNLNLVLDGMVSDSISLYAYAYEILPDGTISYINSYKYAASVDIPQTVLTMRNLSRVGALPEKSYLWLKNNMFNGSTLYDTYYFVTGHVEGNEAVDSYTDILNIAIYENDADLFSKVCAVLGMRIATYNNSPALSMIYRTFEDRYIFYARENLEIAIALM